jgi:hypothetical protein
VAEYERKKARLRELEQLSMQNTVQRQDIDWRSSTTHDMSRIYNNLDFDTGMYLSALCKNCFESMGTFKESSSLWKLKVNKRIYVYSKQTLILVVWLQV